MRIDSLFVEDTNDDRSYTAQQVIDALDGSHSSPAPARTTMTASYQTRSVSPTVYYTALASNGTTIITSRRNTGITIIGGVYTYPQNVAAITDFIAVWDEGNVDDYTVEWIVVDT